MGRFWQDLVESNFDPFDKVHSAFMNVAHAISRISNASLQRCLVCRSNFSKKDSAAKRRVVPLLVGSIAESERGLENSSRCLYRCLAHRTVWFR